MIKIEIIRGKVKTFDGLYVDYVWSFDCPLCDFEIRRDSSVSFVMAQAPSHLENIHYVDVDKIKIKSKDAKRPKFKTTPNHLY